MASFKEHIDFNNLPRHIAVIMDGNGRWAKKKGAMRIFGHRNAVQAVRDVTEGCGEIGIKFLTLYAFSTENWGRPKEEIEGLMELLVNTLKQEIKTLMDNQVKLITIGDTSHLPEDCQKNLDWAINATRNNSGLKLVLALSYSGRWEITRAVKAIAAEVKAGKVNEEDINEEMISRHLQTAEIPDPELLIRTSGEMRVSNFLLWQIAYSELYITPTLWPDFRKEHLYEAIWSYQQRERRFGKTSEQLNPVS
ncbi:MAG TPA: isoprenyl transferase [Cyclobacteriaceae bacterium]|nr:isoprenyl transferase [Cyclobacteriaceae bacterium]HMV07840.1 isoprenyl transferase [Cyclobacteriaceae bacterium]HMV88108.1 isoprenyl transferase [Cyclobacteriaceae bacterium]HMW98974.1 isoprenyl transferase [Cyclobacteriaceae bacterium]HMX48392.1 isoprenyl transferase [Cyclobacteriaceae bacterium]